MMSQMAFDFGEQALEWPKLRQPVFFCIRPTAAAAWDAARIARKLAADLRCRVDKIPAERLHISLQGLGDWRQLPDRVIDAARRAADEISFAPFEATFENVLTLRSGPEPFPSALMGFNAGVRAFHTRLCERLAANGLRANQEINPHMTMFYAPEPVVPRTIDPISFRVSEFVLIRSIHGRGEHRLLGRWPLRAQ